MTTFKKIIIMRPQLLVFNTTLKTAKLYEGNEESKILHYFSNISTVKPKEGYYELIQKELRGDDTLGTSRPIARFPISNTNMLIEE